MNKTTKRIVIITAIVIVGIAILLLIDNQARRDSLEQCLSHVSATADEKYRLFLSTGHTPNAALDATIEQTNEQKDQCFKQFR